MAEDTRLETLADTTAEANPYEPSERIDTLGRAQPTRPKVARGEVTDGDQPIGHAACCHGQRHAILRDGNEYRLEAR